MKATEHKLIKYSFLVLLLGMPFGYKLGGRFAISNITQIISLIMVMPMIFKERNRKYVVGYIFSVLLMCLSCAISALFYESSIRIQYIAFFWLVYIYFGFLIIKIEQKEKHIVEDIKECFKISAYLFCVFFLLMAINEFFILKKVYSGYTFDDKSHTVIFFSVYAMIALQVLKGKMRWLVSIVFFILSLTTTSRLVVVFLLFYFIYLYFMILLEFPGLTGKIIGFLVGFVICALGIYILYLNIDKFTVFARFSSNNISAGNSTKAHIMLIVYAIKLKFENIFNFVFGIGPGNFADVLKNSEVDFSKMMVTDPSVYSAIYAGTTPVHSSHFQILLEFSIFAFIKYCFFLINIFINALKLKNINILFIFIPLMAAVTMYSTHNELLYYCILFYCFIFRSTCKRVEEGIESE